MDEARLIGGTEKRPVVIVDYDPAWPAQYAAEHTRIAVALGPLATRIEHVGSTSVPGLAAKPVIDVQIEVADVADPAVESALVAAGYMLRVDEPGHRMFRTSALDVHVHVWSDPAEIERHLLFRDWLRSHDADRAAYEALKRDLATHDWPTHNDYAEAKGPFIAEIVAKASAFYA